MSQLYEANLCILCLAWSSWTSILHTFSTGIRRITCIKELKPLKTRSATGNWVLTSWNRWCKWDECSTDPFYRVDKRSNSKNDSWGLRIHEQRLSSWDPELGRWNIYMIPSRQAAIMRRNYLFYDLMLLGIYLACLSSTCRVWGKYCAYPYCIIHRAGYEWIYCIIFDQMFQIYKSTS